MAKVYAIQVRTTRHQYEQIKNNAQLRGFSSLSSYLRYMALDRDAAVEQKVREIHEYLLPKKPRGRRKGQKTLNHYHLR
jgi:hypothetical protein